MYSPKISEDLIPVLYKLGKRLKKPMTALVNEMILDSLRKYESVEDEVKSNVGNNKAITYGVNKVACPVCSEQKPAANMRDIEVKIGRKKHILAVCDNCLQVTK